MDPKVKEFINAAKSKERAKFEKERDKYLISLGLIKEQERKYSDAYNASTFPNYDSELKKYYRETFVPVEVTDEEYEEIKKWAEINTPKDTKKQEKSDIEKLKTIGIYILVVGIICAFFLGKIHYNLCG